MIFTRHSLVRAKGEVLVLLYVSCSFFVNDFSTTHGPIHAKFCMRAYSGSGCVFSPFGVSGPRGGGKGEMKFSWKTYVECEWRVCVSSTDALVLFHSSWKIPHLRSVEFLYLTFSCAPFWRTCIPFNTLCSVARLCAVFKKTAFLFMSEIRQISTNFKKFW